MTGICFHALSSGLDRERGAAAAEAAAASSRYDATPVWVGDRLACYDVSYEAYPTTVVDAGESTVIVEGHLYDADPTEAASVVDEHVAEGSPDAALAEWLGQRDGEFVLYHASPDERLTVLGDALGRLPLCYAAVDGAVAGGRSIHFVKHLLDAAGFDLTVDRDGLAETLLLNYALGDKTLIGEIDKAGPATVLDVTPSSIRRSRYREIDLDEPKTPDRSLSAHATAVADRIRDTCRRRANLDGTHLVSLSGGLDSRTVAAGLDAVGADFSAASFTRPATTTRKDVRVALDVAQTLGIEYAVFPVENTGSGMVDLLHRTGGLNYLAMGFLVDYYERLQARYEAPIQHYTGDVGALLKGDWTIQADVASMDDAVDLVLDREGAMPVETVADLTGLEPDRLRGLVADRLRSFPEEQPAHMAEHFLLREHGLNWCYRAEDRNRSFVWNHAPLNARPVVDSLLSVPREYLTDYRLYEAVLTDLDPDLAALPYSPFGAPLGSFEQRAKQRAYELIPNQSRLQRTVKRLVLNRDGYPEPVARCLQDQLSNGADLDDVVDTAALADFAADPSAHTSKAGFDVLTVTSMVEYVRDGDLTLEDYASEEF